jgi:hypothetical protein
MSFFDDIWLCGLIVFTTLNYKLKLKSKGIGKTIGWENSSLERGRQGKCGCRGVLHMQLGSLVNQKQRHPPPPLSRGESRKALAFL